MQAEDAKKIHRQIELATENARKLGLKVDWSPATGCLVHTSDAKYSHRCETLEELVAFLEGMKFQTSLEKARKKEKELPPLELECRKYEVHKKINKALCWACYLDEKRSGNKGTERCDGCGKLSFSGTLHLCPSCRNVAAKVVQPCNNTAAEVAQQMRNKLEYADDVENEDLETWAAQLDTVTVPTKVWVRKIKHYPEAPTVHINKPKEEENPELATHWVQVPVQGAPEEKECAGCKALQEDLSLLRDSSKKDIQKIRAQLRAKDFESVSRLGLLSSWKQKFEHAQLDAIHYQGLYEIVKDERDLNRGKFASMCDAHNAMTDHANDLAEERDALKEKLREREELLEAARKMAQEDLNSMTSAVPGPQTKIVETIAQRLRKMASTLVPVSFVGLSWQKTELEDLAARLETSGVVVADSCEFCEFLGRGDYLVDPGARYSDVYLAYTDDGWKAYPSPELWAEHTGQDKSVAVSYRVPIYGAQPQLPREDALTIANDLRKWEYADHALQCDDIAEFCERIEALHAPPPTSHGAELQSAIDERDKAVEGSKHWRNKYSDLTNRVAVVDATVGAVCSQMEAGGYTGGMIERWKNTLQSVFKEDAMCVHCGTTGLGMKPAKGGGKICVDHVGCNERAEASVPPCPVCKKMPVTCCHPTKVAHTCETGWFNQKWYTQEEWVNYVAENTPCGNTKSCDTLLPVKTADGGLRCAECKRAEMPADWIASRAAAQSEDTE